MCREAVDVACRVIGTKGCPAGMLGVRKRAVAEEEGEKGSVELTFVIALTTQLALFNETRPCYSESPLAARVDSTRIRPTRPRSLPSGQTHAGRLPF